MKILLYSPTHWSISSEYFEPDHHDLVRSEGLLEELVIRINKEAPDLLFIHGYEMNEGFIKSIAKLKQQFPGIAIIPHCIDPDRGFLINLMRAGIHEVLLEDTPDAIREILVRVMQEQKKLDADNQPAGKKIGLISAKGGDGASTLTANLAWLLSTRPKTRVLVVDLTQPLGDLDLFLTSTLPQHTLVDFVEEIDRMDVSLLNSMAQHINSQLDFIASPRTYEQAYRISPDPIKRLITIAQHSYEYVILDFGSQPGPFFLNLVEQLDEVMLVVTANMSSIRQASQLMLLWKILWKELEIENAKLSVVLNRYHQNSTIKVEDLKRALGCTAQAIIPEDSYVAEKSLVSSSPVVHLFNTSKMGVAIMNWASKWTGLKDRESKSLWHRLKIK